MFLLNKGRRVLILHSYRDGRGKVCQRRLGHFCDHASLELVLAKLSQNNPNTQLLALRLQAEEMLNGGGHKVVTPQQRAERIRRATRSLLAMLAEEEDPEVLSQAAVDLSQLQARLSGPEEFEEPLALADRELERGSLKTAEAGLRDLVKVTASRLSPRRRRFEPTEVKAQPYLRALDGLGKTLHYQDRLEECAQVMAERVKRCPTSRARLFYGSLLQRLGRNAEASQQYAWASKGEAFRHYNAASVSWQDGRHDECLVHLLRGYSRDTSVVEALQRLEAGKPIYRGAQYWQEFGQLWSDRGRRFILATCTQFLVRNRLSEARERGIRVRDLVPARSRVLVLQRGMESVLAEKPS